MDHSYPYIASLTREPFLFYEMRSTAKLMSEGLSDEAIGVSAAEGIICMGWNRGACTGVVPDRGSFVH